MSKLATKSILLATVIFIFSANTYADQEPTLSLQPEFDIQAAQYELAAFGKADLEHFFELENIVIQSPEFGRNFNLIPDQLLKQPYGLEQSSPEA